MLKLQRGPPSGGSCLRGPSGKGTENACQGPLPGPICSSVHFPPLRCDCSFRSYKVQLVCPCLLEPSDVCALRSRTPSPRGALEAPRGFSLHIALPLMSETITVPASPAGGRSTPSHKHTGRRLQTFAGHINGKYCACESGQ